MFIDAPPDLQLFLRYCSAGWRVCQTPAPFISAPSGQRQTRLDQSKKAAGSAWLPAGKTVLLHRPLRIRPVLRSQQRRRVERGKIRCAGRNVQVERECVDRQDRIRIGRRHAIAAAELLDRADPVRQVLGEVAIMRGRRPHAGLVSFYVQ